MRLHRLVEDRADIMPVEQERRVEHHRAGGEDEDRDLCDERLGHVDRERPAPQLVDHRRRGHRPFRVLDREPHRPARKEDEQLGGIRERQVAVGEALEEVAGDVIDEDGDQRVAAPEIDRVGLAHRRSATKGEVRRPREYGAFWGRRRGSRSRSSQCRFRAEAIAENRRQRVRDIFGDEAGAEAPRCFGMHPDGGAGRLEGRHALGE